MCLTAEQLQAFIECWQADFGETLTPAEAESEATRLLELVQLLAATQARQERRRHKESRAPPSQ